MRFEFMKAPGRILLIAMLALVGALAGCAKTETASTDTAVTETVAPDAVSEAPDTAADAAPPADQTATTDGGSESQEK